MECWLDENLKHLGYLPPWSVEFDEKELVLFDFIIEAVIGKDKDALICFGGGNSGHNIGSCEQEK
jgi:hypothetical protein